ncbi:MAG: T9SS type A sorting domain-containing protein [Bacteroidota bacterium]
MNARIPFPDHPAGFVELQYQTPAIGSLYETQLNFRLNNPPLPDAPTRLEAQAVNGNILLSWQDVAADEVGYEVQYKTSEAGAYEVLATLDANTSSYEFIYADTFEMLTYRVSALGVNCRSPYSNPVTIEISTSTLSTDENKLRVYPNPFQEYVSIRSSQNIRSITVHAVSGRILLETQSTNLLTTKNWPPGIYLLTVTDEEGNRSSTKVVKH